MGLSLHLVKFLECEIGTWEGVPHAKDVNTVIKSSGVPSGHSTTSDHSSIIIALGFDDGSLFGLVRNGFVVS